MLTIGLLAVAGALPLDLVWNVSPPPHREYAACGGDTTVCVTPGDWWGICRAEQFGATTRTLTSGTLTLQRGEAHFSGCPHYEALVSKSVKLGGDPTKAAFADPGCRRRLGKSKVNLAPLGDKTIAVKANEDGTVQVALLPGRVASCDHIADIVWPTAFAVQWDGPEMPLVASWDVEIIGDLNQDGAPELILAKQSERSATDYAALFGTVRGNGFERLAATVTTPKLALTPEAKLVQSVQDAHDACQHWAGEDGDGDRKRNAQIASGKKKHCAAFKAKLASALRKYPGNTTLQTLSKSELLE